MISSILSKLRTRRFMGEDPVGYARSLGVRVGDRCRLLDLNGGTFGSEPWLITIGDHVTITTGVHFVTHDGGVWVFREEHPDADLFGPIAVGNNVFLGLNVTLMPGITIGNNVVIGAGAIVTRDIPGDSVAVGAPAKVVMTLAEYWAKVEPRLSNTGRMLGDEKRAFLTGRRDSAA
jgi:acetyltransferase-like isoleucine patch superfamily enzyme